ncbi:MAG: glycosyltransferase family 2 protein [Phycisphaerae bacterium]
MSNGCRPHISFVLATHNRRAVAIETLARVARCGLDRRDYEIIAVDNASDDGTPEAIAAQTDILIRLRHNAGSCAKSYGVKRAGGRYIVFLDDDSFPHPGSVARMVERFEEDPDLGAAGFVVHLPDGRKEGSALPGVFVGCGVGLRAEAFRMVGGLDRSFFMQAEEYDLAFRLVGAGWRVRTFDDLHVDHLKTACARKTERTTYYDIRNNLRVLARYLPSPSYEIYRADALQRYAWLAQRDQHIPSFVRGVLAGQWHGLRERWIYRARRLSADALEHFFRWKFVQDRMADLARRGVRRIVLADLGKNVFAFHRAARETGITVMAVGDNNFYAPGRWYRGVPVLPLDEALEPVSVGCHGQLACPCTGGQAASGTQNQTCRDRLLGREPDAVVVGNSSAVHGTDTYNRLTTRLSLPVYHWFGPGDQPVSDEIHSPAQVESADSPFVGVTVAAT